MNKFRDLSIGLFFIVATACIVSITFKVDTVVGKFGTTLTMTSAAAQQLSSTLKSQKEQLDEPAVVKARKDSQLQLAELTKHLSQVTIKKFDQNLDTLNKVTNNTAGMVLALNAGTTKTLDIVNHNLLPPITDFVSNTSKLAESLNISQAQVNAAIVTLINNGTTTTEIVNKRLADPKFDELLAGAIELQRDGHVVLGKVEAVGANLDEATRPLGPMVKNAQKWQWVWNTGRLLGLLTTLFK